MKSNSWLSAMAVLACFGCNMGNAPEPMSESQLKSAVEKLSPKEQIDYIKASPMPPQMKAQRIKEVEDKTGYKDAGGGAASAPGH